MNTIRSAFSLIEMLVVIAVIATLMAISVPYLSTAKSRAKGIECQKNLGDWAKALNMYIDESRTHRLPKLGDGTSDASAWYNVLPKEVDIRPLCEYKEGETIPAPKSGVKSMYVCPLASKASGDGVFSYAANAFFENNGSSLHAAKIGDASAFIVFMDAPDSNSSSATRDQVLAPGSDSFRHGSRMNAAFFDGSVRSLQPRQVRAGSDDPKKINEHNIYWDAFPEE
jgi:prepilin-type N-terminal cleavage/methylation domain-containing protein/prepilin-type processing-associated H-X9-DG protein